LHITSWALGRCCGSFGIMTRMPQVQGFTVSIHPGGVISAEEAAPLSPHDLILRPILQFADSAVVLDAPSDSRAVREAAAILSPEPHRLRITLDREVIRGYERLWNAGAGKRGTIAIKSRITEDRLDALFGLCGSAWSWEPKAEREVFGMPALRYVAAEVSPGCRVFLLSRSNGIEWLGVYGVPDEVARLLALAEGRCKPFKRWFEVSEPERYNIIGQYDKMWTAEP
jgi:hypothetical protein